jgi:hypothetical protein
MMRRLQRHTFSWVDVLVCSVLTGALAAWVELGHDPSAHIHAPNHQTTHAAWQVVVATLMKLAGGSPSFNNELNVDAFLQQVGTIGWLGGWDGQAKVEWVQVCARVAALEG